MDNPLRHVWYIRQGPFGIVGEEYGMRIAYLMLTHKDYELAYRVAKKLTTETCHHVFIHVDKKTDISPFLKLETLGHQIHLLSNRLSVFWGGAF